jgi:hypothetical protein
LFFTILSGSISILGGTEINYVTAQNISNSSMMWINITNSTGDEKGISGNSTGIDTETSLPPESEDTGSIASLPNKCLGSALCPD